MLIKSNHPILPSVHTKQKNNNNVTFCGAPQVQEIEQKVFKNDIFKSLAVHVSNLSNQKSDNILGKAVTGSLKFLEKRLDFKGHNMSLQTLMGLCFGIVLGARLLQARDKNERREVATRDFAAVSTIIFALPLLKKATSFATKKITGIPISHTSAKDIGKFIKNLWPNSGIQPASFEQLEHWYSKTDNIHQFSTLTDKLGGDLKKIFNLLPDSSKKALETIAQKTKTKTSEVKSLGSGYNLMTGLFNQSKDSKLLLPDSNEAIIKMLSDAKDNPNLKNQLTTLSNAVKEKDGLLKAANFYKSVPDLASLGIVAGFLGWALPWFNIQFTKKMVAQEQQQLK